MDFKSTVSADTPIREAIGKMNGSASNKFIAGIAIVLDNQARVIGVVTDGDIRRGLSRGISVDAPVEKIANFKPLVLDCRLSAKAMRQRLIEQTKRRGSDFRKFEKLILVDRDQRLFDVIRLADILASPIEDKTIAVYGLGYVGLTLAATFANVGLSVVGIERDTGILEKLERNQSPFYENGLESLLLSISASNPIQLCSDIGAIPADVHIISVGTPLGPDRKPDLTALRAVISSLAKVLKRGDLVVLRSTVPVGTTRRIVLPLLESSGLASGDDFHLAFAPERTAEGRALEELRVLPQIIGGLDYSSVELTGRLFSEITHTIVEVGSLEAAELVKLMNNTFRDVAFSFANEVAFLCDSLNLDAFRLIQAANEGYPRNPIPLPSPGVAGLCLSKDPFLYSHPVAEMEYRPILGQASRSINSQGARYVLSKLDRFCEITKSDLRDLKILVVGLAFKGTPETSDYRDSISLDILKALPNRGNVAVKDFVIAPSDISALGYSPAGDIAEAFSIADAILVMNNHYLTNRFNVVQSLRGGKRPKLLFDGWHMFDRLEIESIGHVFYATMGYMTEQPR
jgi:UDP-N-acetyl-D-mannosaminuronic acid dehydrogenase